MQGRRILFWYVPMYDYWWGLTAAQVDLLSIDAPMVAYKHEQKRDKNGKIIPKKANAADVLKAAISYEEKIKKNDTHRTVNFGDFNIQ